MQVHEGPARVFDCEEDAIEAIRGGKIVAGDVVVIRYEGPKGGPGMREMLNPTSAIAGMGLGSSVALITDGRFPAHPAVHPSVMSARRQQKAVRSRSLRKAISSVSIFRSTSWSLPYRMKSWHAEKLHGLRESRK